MRLSEFQRAADSTDTSSKAPWVGFTQNLFGLVDKVGEMSGAVKLRLRDRGSYSASTFRTDMERYIGEALWYLAAVATHFNLDLEEIATKNLAANRQRWGLLRDAQGRLFHGRARGNHLSERFPEKVHLEFTSTAGPNQMSWLDVTGVRVDGVPFGDPIDDNTRLEDGYRFHDILHFAFAAYLDWSPVVRKLLNKKRKSNEKEDKYEDGARARDTEEAVTNLIHRYARGNEYLKQAKRLDTDFLYSVQAQVRDLEVRDRTAAEWEECILRAYDIYRELIANHGGHVDVYCNEEPRLEFVRVRD